MNTRIFTDEKSFITLKDGRKLGFRVYGPSKKEEADQIVLYFVGTPGTRNYLTTKQEQQLTKYNQICFITVERPGFGISDHKHGRTIMDYVQDVEEFAKQLEIIKCSIIAYSGGGPFALACAYKLPHLITNVVSVCSLGPRSAPNSTKNMYWQNRLGFWIAHYSSWLVKQVILSEASKFLHESDPCKGVLDHYAYNETDSQYLKENEQVLKMFADNTKYCYEQGQAETEAWEYHLFAIDWNFNLEQVLVPVSVYWGCDDTACVPAMGEYISNTLKNSTVHPITSASHMVMFSEFDKILQDALHIQSRTL